MALETWLIDSSAFYKLALSQDLELWESRIERGLVHVASVTLLEIGYSVRSPSNYDQIFEAGIVRNLVEVSTSADAERRAFDIQKKLVAKGQHRGVSLVDFLVAALGDQAGHTILHDDKDFDLIKGITDQAIERLRLED